MLSKETLPETVVKMFSVRYEGLTTHDVQWLISKFRLLNAGDIDIRKGKVERLSAYKAPKSFSLVSQPITPTFVMNRKPRPKPASSHGNAEKTKAPVQIKVTEIEECSDIANAAEGNNVNRKEIALKQLGGGDPADS